MDIVMYGLGLISIGVNIAVFIVLREHKKPAQPRTVDEQEIEKAKKLRKGFDDLMSYDVSKALGKKVT
jgi:hypothetical protein